MGYKVFGLSIHEQAGDNPREVYAQWNFAPGATKVVTTTTPSGTSKVRVGSWVKIKSGVTKWYNGVTIASGITNQTWYVSYLTGDRAVLSKNKSGTQNIQSPINVNNLVVEGASSSGGSTTTTITNTTKASEILSHLDNFKVRWYYYVPGNGWFLDQDTTEDKTPDSGSITALTGAWRTTYTAKEGATKVKVWVKPVSKKYNVVVDKKKNKTVEKDWWTGEGKSIEFKIVENTEPPQLSAPTVTINKLKLTATIELSNTEENARVTDVQFQIHNGKSNITSTSDKKTKVEVKTGRAIFTYTVPAGGKYRVRCRGINENGKNADYGKWSDYSSEDVRSSPTSTEFTDIHATGATSVRLQWKKIDAANHYQIEYTTDDKYFNNSAEPTMVDTSSSESAPASESWHITDMEGGKEYFFRVRALRDDEPSAWSKVKSITIGQKPNAPTTWSSTNTIMEGEMATLYWIHNTGDGSRETQSEIYLKCGSQEITYVTINPDDEDKPETVRSLPLGEAWSTALIGGSTVSWKVRTAGIYEDKNGLPIYGPWSDTKTIKVIDQPTIDLKLYDYNNTLLSHIRDNEYSGETIREEDAVIDRYPFSVKASVITTGQKVISYSLKITADDEYVVQDLNGNDRWIAKGDVVYQKTWNVNNTELNKKFSPADIDLESGITYIVTCEAATNQGASVDTSTWFTVDFIDTVDMYPDADVLVDESDYTAYIAPYVYDDDDELVLCRIDVYRRAFDGSYILIEGNMSNNERTIVVDPHPALDSARYRIVAQNNTTGEMVYYDLPDTPIDCPYIVIQWDEAWASFEVEDGRANVLRETVISQLILKYNVNVSEQNEKDVSLIEYIGRDSPVSYYGTQKGEGGNWSVEIPTNDTETIHMLRKLARWMGDVYVREPSGTGYWANVSVSFNQSYNELTIPVSINVTRVEGGA